MAFELYSDFIIAVLCKEFEITEQYKIIFQTSNLQILCLSQKLSRKNEGKLLLEDILILTYIFRYYKRTLLLDNQASKL